MNSNPSCLGKDKRISQSAGFEPARGDPIGFQVQRLNHSATAACYSNSIEKDNSTIEYV